MRSGMSLKFGEILPWTAELAAFEHFKPEDQWSYKRSPETRDIYQ